MKNIHLTESKLYDIINECFYEILKEETFNGILEDAMYNYDEFSLLQEFLDNKRMGIQRIEWDLIPAEQYKNLITRYMSAPNPTMARIPENIVGNWIYKIVHNLLKLQYITEFAGHESFFPSDACEDMFGNDIDWSDYDEAFEFLENIGFYDWCKLPDGSNAWSDFGLRPIYKILSAYNPAMEGWETLLLINRILDITHHRGDLPSAFIEGGSATCSQISSLNESVKYNDCDFDFKLNEGIGHFLGNAYQWLRNKYYNFKNDFEAGRRYQRFQNKDYDPYNYYGDEAKKFRNLGGQEYSGYRYNLTKDRNKQSDLDWENEFGTQTNSWKKPTDNPDLSKKKTTAKSNNTKTSKNKQNK